MLFLVRVELVGGKPDLQLPPTAQIERHSWGAMVYWHDRVLLLDRLGRRNGDLLFLGHGSRDVMTRLAHLGNKVRRLRNVAGNAPLRAWLRTKGLWGVRVNGVVQRVMPRHVIAGHSPVALALEEYTLNDGDVVDTDK